MVKKIKHIINSETSNSIIVNYYQELKSIFSKIKLDTQHSFSPAFELPELTQPIKDFFSCGTMSCVGMGSYRDKNLYFLNLMQNPDTQTTKTIPSLLMVARAVQHIQKTGEKILIITPSSGNKAIALRNAVERALVYKLVAPDQLRILTLTPENALYKLRESDLSANKDMLALNPIAVSASKNPEDVKNIAHSFVDTFSEDLYKNRGLRVWYTLDINNYKVADALRAFCCHDILGEKECTHAHAVSSAYGLLGFHFGHQILKASGVISVDPQYFLIQHLQTHAMVENIITDDKFKTPTYHWNDDSKIFEQSNNPYYPFHTHAIDECIDPTFYTRNPNTNETMAKIIRKNGGGGIVISRHECLEKYPVTQSLLNTIGIALPKDTQIINEWSLIMAMTGVLNALDRNLIQGNNIVIHGSGFYCNDDYVPIGKDRVRYITSSEDLYSLCA